MDKLISAFYDKSTRTLRTGACIPIDPGPGEVQLTVAYGGICGTDMHILHGNMDWRLSAEHVLGHEISGIVTAVGSGVADIKRGDRVVIMPLNPTGDDPIRRAGLEHIAESLKFMGIDSPGGFQSKWTVPAHTVFKLPPELPLKQAALIEPLAVACHDVRLGQVKSGDYSVVIGGGPIGALVALVARERGARVVVSEVNPHRISLFRSLGLDVVNPQEIDLPELIKQETDGTMADVVFEVTGHASGIEMATKLPRARGLIVIVGIFSIIPQVDLFRIFWRELRLQGARVYEREDYLQAIALATEGRLPLDQIISAVYPLTQIAEAVARMEAGGDVMKVLLEINPPAGEARA